MTAASHDTRFQMACAAPAHLTANEEREGIMAARSVLKKKTAARAEWRVTRSGIRFTVKRGRESARNDDGTVRTFRTRDAAARIARELNR